MAHTISSYTLGDMQVIYQQDGATGEVGFLLFPQGMSEALIEKKCKIEPLVQAKIIGDDYPPGFAQGRTMRNSQTVCKMKYKEQQFEKCGIAQSIITTLVDDRGYIYKHCIRKTEFSPALEITTAITNNSSEPIDLEMLSSFTLGGITPFEYGDAEESLILHRLQSNWSAEGRMLSQPVEDLQLEPSWANYSANCIRYGQVGSMPVRGYFPYVVVEDIKCGVCWGVQLAIASSWQIEVYRRDSGLSVSGGIVDREFGHWVKRLSPGESFTTPKAIVSTAAGNVEIVSQRIAENVRQYLENSPSTEKDLPIIFNEFCTTWGVPSEALVKTIADKLKNKGVSYFVIDAGWYADEQRGWADNMGEWIESTKLFPNGLKETAAYIRDCGMIPGIWFEFEVSGRESTTFSLADHLLQRDGLPITVGSRRFWDMRQPWVIDYLTMKVIHFLKENGFGYLKVDYNDTLGIGCEGAESLGEGLRQQIEGTLAFFKKLRTEMPDLIIEGCSSGGHRLVQPFFELTSMSSFSDAHECDEIPIIAANLHNVLLPRQSQIWAVLKKESNEQKLYYQMCSTFLGRCCLSGEVAEMSENQWEIVQNGISFYKNAVATINNGISKRHGPKIMSYRHTKGWQCIERTNTENGDKLLVMHTFADFNNGDIEIDLNSDHCYQITKIYSLSKNSIEIDDNIVTVKGLSDFEGIAVLLSYT